MDVGDAGGVQRPLGGGPEVEPAVADDVGAEPLAERPRDLVSDLVAARADSRADRRSQLRVSERGDGARDDSREQAAPADVQRRDRRRPAVRAGDRDRQAVGGEDEQGLAGRVRPEPVARLAASRPPA